MKQNKRGTGFHPIVNPQSIVFLLFILGCVFGANSRRRDRGVVDLIRAYNTATVEYVASGEWHKFMKGFLGATSSGQLLGNYMLAMDFETAPGDCKLHVYDWPDPSLTPYQGLFHKFLSTGELNVGIPGNSCLTGLGVQELIRVQKTLLGNILLHYNITKNLNTAGDYVVNFTEEPYSCDKESLSEAMDKLRNGVLDVILGDVPITDGHSNNGIFGCSIYGDDIGVLKYVRPVLTETDGDSNLKIIDPNIAKYGTLQETIHHILQTETDYKIITRVDSPAMKFLTAVPVSNIGVDFSDESSAQVIYYIDESLYLMSSVNLSNKKFIHNFFNSPIYRYAPMFPFAGYIEGYGGSQLTLALNSAIDHFYSANATIIQDGKKYQELALSCAAQASCKFSVAPMTKSAATRQCVNSGENTFTVGTTLCISEMQKVWIETYYPLLLVDQKTGLKTYGTLFIPQFGFPGTSGFGTVKRKEVMPFGKLNYAIISGYLRIGVGPMALGVNTQNSFYSNVIGRLGSYFGENYGRTVSFAETYDSFRDENRARCMLSGQTPNDKTYNQVKPAADIVLATRRVAGEYSSDYTIDLFSNIDVCVGLNPSPTCDGFLGGQSTMSTQIGAGGKDPEGFNPKATYDLSNNQVKLRKLIVHKGEVSFAAPYLMASWMQGYMANPSGNPVDLSRLQFNSKLTNVPLNLQISFDYNQPEIETPKDETARTYSVACIVMGIVTLVIGLALFFIHIFGKDAPGFVDDTGTVVPQINIAHNAMAAAPIADAALEDREIM